jgi:8-oxo-dGTP pyrophosphatase MutT (NUDIX family)
MPNFERQAIMAIAAVTYKDDITPQELVRRIRHRLDGNGLQADWGAPVGEGHITASAVLFLLTCRSSSDNEPAEPCLLLNKRSQQVLQPGDLCCPGGGIEPKDRLLSHVLGWPFSPLLKWPGWKRWKHAPSQSGRRLALSLAAALREGWEEMRLNPFRVAFMGPLPIQKLVMFRRDISPLAGWVTQEHPLVPNWEVARIVHIPLRKLLQQRYYARYRLRFDTARRASRSEEDFPCFVHHDPNGEEILWGATFRITMDFLKLVFGFERPDLSGAPVIHRKLDETYLNGSRNHPPRKPREQERED